MFSAIADQFDLPTNRLYRLRDELARKQIRMTDLVSGNVNSQGILFPMELFQKALAAGVRAGRVYCPDPLGQPTAREAISRIYAKEGFKVPSEQLLLTPGTSISHWYAFKLLANPGEEILCPTPSYPLFDSIAALSGVALTHYPLREGTRWEIDFESLEAAITPRTKAIILISPHNPTGAVATAEEVQRLGEIASRRHLAIISDEVFSSFVFRTSPRQGVSRGPASLSNDTGSRLTTCRDDGYYRPATSSAPLVITMNGLSKMLALPGMKIGWMTVTGEPSLVKKSLKTLEMISDTFLPVNEAAQFALPHILKSGAVFQKSYKATIQDRMATAVKTLEGQSGISLVKPEGGFFLTLRLNGSCADEEEDAWRLLQKHRILVHPGYFYDMEGQHLVLSFVSRPELLRRAVSKILEMAGSLNNG